MRFASVLTVVAFTVLAAEPCLAQPAPKARQEAAPPAAASMTRAEVRKVDKAAASVTLKHEAIKNLDMGAMTMTFRARDKSLLDKVKQGDKVRFAAQIVDGELIVTALEPAR